MHERALRTRATHVPTTDSSRSPWKHDSKENRSALPQNWKRGESRALAVGIQIARSEAPQSDF